MKRLLSVILTISLALCQTIPTAAATYKFGTEAGGSSLVKAQYSSCIRCGGAFNKMTVDFEGHKYGNCPGCGADYYPPDYEFTSQFDIWYCSSCGYATYFDTPEVSEIKSYCESIGNYMNCWTASSVHYGDCTMHDLPYEGDAIFEADDSGRLAPGDSHHKTFAQDTDCPSAFDNFMSTFNI